MNEELKEHLGNALKANTRLDGRKLEDFRNLTIETGVVPTAEGSARVRCGETDVIAGVKLSVGTPFPDTPDEGVLMVGTELLPLSNPEFESGPPSIDSIEISRVIDRAVRESKSVDTKGLCITPGEKVWIVSVDICPINTDGNLIDVGTIATIAAIRNARLPQYKNGKVDYKVKTDASLPVKELPLNVTVLKIASNYLVDPTEQEEKATDARLSFGILADGRICSLQKGGSHPIKLVDIEKMADIAINTAGKLRKQLPGE